MTKTIGSNEYKGGSTPVQKLGSKKLSNGSGPKPVKVSGGKK